MQQADHLPVTVSQRSLRDRVGIFSEGADIVDAIAQIREAEQVGVQHIWAQNSGNADLLTLFAAVATQTERIRLGSAIVPIYPRHPLVMAQQALAVHGLAPGRLRLGIGPGSRMAIENWYGLSQTAPLSYLKEYLEILRGLLGEGSIDYHGTFFQVKYTLPRTAPIPLLVSALNPKAFRLAGEIADGALSWMCPIPYLLKVALPELRAGVQDNGRPTPPVVAHVLVALSTDEAAVRASTRQRVQAYAQLAPFAQMFANAGFAGVAKDSDARLDALAQTLVVSGNEATVRSHLEELLASGLDELMLQLVPVADEGSERKQLIHLVGSL
jgi:Coenzyme F420-dependent N5,N10-methylene tetrahydromethanopterin reductase and related flavin-dependent oxidoreductases